MIRTMGVAALIAMVGVTALAEDNPSGIGTMPVDAVPFSSEAVNRAFSQLSEDERYVIQQRLERRGFYQGTVDGLTGPGTRDAIRAQATAVVTAGEQVRLDTEEEVRVFLSGLLPLPPEELPEGGDAFFGTWDCQGSAWTYGYDGFMNEARTNPLPYMSIEEFTPGNFGITYMDGYRTGLMDVTPTTMIWLSPESGDSFDCRRVSAPPPRPEMGVAEQPQVREEIEAVPTAPPVVDTAQPSRPEAKPAPATTAWPFEGAWSCLSDTFGNSPLAFSFGPDSVSVPALGSTIGYADVTTIGGRETAYLVSLMDGQQAALVELEADRMVLFAAGNLFDCTRETQP